MRETREALALALAELRELTHGINPPLLTERGLPAALDELCRRAALPTHLQLTLDRRLPDQIETAAYFIASEALTNAAKHSHGTEVRVTASDDGQRLTVEVADDGIGGASTTGGSGLRGLADRVEALGGRFTVSSPPGPRHDAASGDPVRVALADDAVLLREGLSRLLEEAGFEVVGLAARRRRAARAGRAHASGRRDHRHPDAADAHRRGPARRQGRSASDGRRSDSSCSPSTSTPATRSSCSRPGPTASATCSRSACRTSTSCHRASTASAHGGSVLDPAVVGELVGRRRQADNPLEHLTDREREVLALMAEGRSNHAIAERLFVTDHTVEKHVKNIFGSLRLPLSPDDHRRVLAVVTYLNSQ